MARRCRDRRWPALVDHIDQGGDVLEAEIEPLPASGWITYAAPPRSASARHGTGLGHVEADREGMPRAPASLAAGKKSPAFFCSSASKPRHRASHQRIGDGRAFGPDQVGAIALERQKAIGPPGRNDLPRGAMVGPAELHRGRDRAGS